MYPPPSCLVLGCIRCCCACWLKLMPSMDIGWKGFRPAAKGCARATLTRQRSATRKRMIPEAIKRHRSPLGHKSTVFFSPTQYRGPTLLTLWIQFEQQKPPHRLLLLLPLPTKGTTTFVDH
ncbi:hypothetical protein TYRP_007839 [Tyrophagus putrescentiae]|nr:hypothetical protein TYRP_007839 [Tyrophagus putrescentiae]